MIVREILSAEPAQMFFVERDYVVQQLAAGIADPTLSCTVLPRTADAGSDRFNPAAGQQFANSRAEFGIAVEDGISERAGKREGFPQLLCDPIASLVHAFGITVTYLIWTAGNCSFVGRLFKLRAGFQPALGLLKIGPQDSIESCPTKKENSSRGRSTKLHTEPRLKGAVQPGRRRIR